MHGTSTFNVQHLLLYILVELQQTRATQLTGLEECVATTCTIFGNAIAGGYGLFVFIWQVFVSIVDVS